ncbi:spore germination protein KB [Paenibacillus phyllosphaerae]|uniref:Spore germination protein KB n=1 Tax=Paenibacillus phyllosphaerae TaxID=274593 RepID=A0A7W5B262_9BACL|nr:endospore germination permease [Paenibacillus phyllosphaerae]MBB3113058.1 spore germination protein KB [Paenibacillus phyllosphaerae]
MNEKITSLQASALIMFAIVPTGILLVPGAVVGVAGQNAWLSVLAGMVISVGLAILVGIVCRQYQDAPFLQWIEQRCGRLVAALLGLYLTRYYMTTAAVTLREFTNFISEEIMPNTPELLLKIIIMLVVVYAVIQGIETIVRVNIVIFFISVVLMFMGLFLIGENIEIRNLLPIWEGTPMSFMHGALLTLAWLSEVSLLLILGPYLRKNSPLIRTGIVGVMMAGSGILITVIVAMATFGNKITQMLTFPSFVIVSLVEIGSFLERLEIVFISLWIMTMYVKLAVFLFGAAHCFISAFKLETERLFILLLGLLILLTSQYSWANTAEFHRFTLMLGTPDLFASNIVLPLVIGVVLVVSSLWSKRVEGSG